LSLKPARNPIPKSTFGDVGAFYQVRASRPFSNALLEIPYSRARAKRVDEHTLRLFRWDESSGSLILVDTSVVDVERRIVWGRISEPGLYGLIGLPSDANILRTLGIFSLFSAAELIDSPELIPPICGLILCQPDGGDPNPPGGLPGTICDQCLGLQVPQFHLPEIQTLRSIPGRVFSAIPFAPIQTAIWPGQRHDYRNTLQSARNGPAVLPVVAWSFTFDSNKLLGAPVVAPDGTVYVASADYGQIPSVDLFAFDGASGQMRWSASAPDTGAHVAEPAIGPDGTVYVSYLTATGAGRLDAFTSYGSLKWRFTRAGNALGSPMPSPDKSVYVLSESEGIIKLDNNGNEAWPAPLGIGNPSIQSGFTPVAVRDDGTLIVRGAGDIRALRANGQVMWTYASQDTWLIPPIVADDGRVIVVMYQSPGILVLDSSGNLQDTWPAAPLNYAAAGRDGNVYFSTGSDLQSLAPAGAARWDRNLGSPLSSQTSGPSIGYDGTIYVSVNRPMPQFGLDVHAIDPANGNDRWVAQTSAGPSGTLYSFAPVIGAGGTLLIVDANTLYALR
jgi:outer membrane protein assembly factor BamB